MHHASCLLLLALILLLPICTFAKLTNNIHENERQYGNEITTKQYSEDGKRFTGKIVYPFPLYGWQVETIFIDGRSISESARPKGNKAIKKIISEKEANVIADMLYPKKERGPYRKQVKNANFISHFFEKGVISYEMQLDLRRKNYIGVTGVRAILYEREQTFKDIMINAYH